MSDPAPLPPQSLLGHWFLSRSLPQIFISDLLFPSDFVDAPQTGVEEFLNILSHSLCLSAMSHIRRVGLSSPFPTSEGETSADYLLCCSSHQLIGAVMLSPLHAHTIPQACVHRLDLGLYSRPKEFWGNGVRTHVNSKRKIPSTKLRGGSNPRRCITPDSAPSTLQTELFRPPITSAKSGNVASWHPNYEGSDCDFSAT